MPVTPAADAPLGQPPQPSPTLQLTQNLLSQGTPAQPALTRDALPQVQIPSPVTPTAAGTTAPPQAQVPAGPAAKANDTPAPSANAAESSPATADIRQGQVVPIKAAPATPPATAQPAVLQPTAVPLPGAGPRAMPPPLHAPAPSVTPPVTPAIPAQQKPAQVQSPPAAGPARLRLRHYGIAISFVLCVIVPTILSVAYLMTMARDQYASSMSFSVRREEFQSTLGLLGGISKLSGSAGSDIDILNEFILSQQMVQKVAADTDLAAAFSSGWPTDFVFAFDPAGSIEDLQDFWHRQVEVNIDAGLIQIRTFSYDPALSEAINRSIFKHSGDLVNTLSAEARRDATMYSEAELVRAETRLADAREAMTSFRLRTQIVDPASAAQSQLGVLNTLNAQLAEELVKLDLLNMQGQTSDPRVTESERRIQAITNRIEAEKAKFGPGGEGAGGEDYSTLFAQYERLLAEMRFAEESYRVAQVSHDSALSDAQRKSRYIVAHVEPTRAEASTKPHRGQLSVLSFLFLLLTWSMGILVYYSIRDRR